MSVSDDEYQRFWHPGQDGPDPAEQTRLIEQPARVPAQRRKVLFALGGLTLLAGGGVAAGIAAATRSTNGKTVTAGAAPTTSQTAGAGAGTSASPTASASSSPTASATPTTSVVTKPQYYVDDDGPRAIALTMDDGPHPIYTPQVLEIFRKHDIKATFNMIGSQVGANLSLVREVSAEGHTITNHTWDHSDLTHFTLAQVLSQMDRCNEALANANQHPTIFRAPYGNWAKPVFEACAERNLRAVDWSVDPRDWDTAHVDTTDIVDNVMRHTRPHDIILEHDGGGVRRNTVAALKIFIPRLLDEGYNFVAM
jgi:peptidoglycan/xylan/chitin deacetylase (PgdA/CDA1 family)